MDIPFANFSSSPSSSTASCSVDVMKTPNKQTDSVLEESVVTPKSRRLSGLLRGSKKSKSSEKAKMAASHRSTHQAPTTPEKRSTPATLKKNKEASGKKRLAKIAKTAPMIAARK
uniref:Uncharacterized protein n=1 Tax=Caenorhabditis japonica TaxID=281687 RepID=A0A8R1EGX7_CAEJA